MRTDQVLGLQGQIVLGDARHHLMTLAFQVGKQLGQQFVCPLATPAFPGTVGHPFAHMLGHARRACHQDPMPGRRCVRRVSQGFKHAPGVGASSTYTISRFIEHLSKQRENTSQTVLALSTRRHGLGLQPFSGPACPARQWPSGGWPASRRRARPPRPPRRWPTGPPLSWSGLQPRRFCRRKSPPTGAR
jgi:hypothetical protein